MYIYEKYNFRIVTLVLGLMAFIFMAYNEYIGAAISIAVGVLVSFSFQGIKIDPEKKRFKRYDRIASLTIGRWEKLPEPSYVTLVRINLSSRRMMPAPMVMPENKKGAKAYKVNLVVEDEMRYLSVCRGSREKMREEALKLGQLMGIRVLDYTTHNKKWIL